MPDGAHGFNRGFTGPAKAQNTMKNTIAIKVKNPTKVSKNFGECAGDFSASEAVWWVGTPKELYLRGEKPSGARVVEAPVCFSGGQGWIPMSPRRQAAKNAMQERSRGLSAFYPHRVGWWRELASQMRDAQSRGWKVTAKDYGPAVQPRAPRLP